MAVTQGTWGPQSGILGFLNPFSRDIGFTEKLPSSYSAQNYNTFVNPNQPSPAYNIYGQPNYQVPTGSSSSTDKVSNPKPLPTGAIPSSPQVPTPSSPSMPSFNNNQNGINSEIDSMYNGAFDLLNQRQALLPQLRDTAVQQLNDSTTSLTDSLNAQKAQAQQQIDLQQQTVEQGKASALSEAMRNYNALLNQTQNRYGGGSGAGQFISELIGQEMMRGQNTIAQGYQQSMQQIQNYAINVDTQVMNEVRRIEREKATAMKSIEDTLSERLLAINADKTTLERQKAEQKYDALQQSIAAQRSYSQAYQQALFDASSWKGQQENLIKDAVSQLEKQWSTTQESNQDNVRAATTAPTFTSMANTQSNLAQTNYRPYSTKTDDTENPWNVESYFTATA